MERYAGKIANGGKCKYLPTFRSCLIRQLFYIEFETAFNGLLLEEKGLQQLWGRHRIGNESAELTVLYCVKGQILKGVILWH